MKKRIRDERYPECAHRVAVTRGEGLLHIVIGFIGAYVGGYLASALHLPEPLVLDIGLTGSEVPGASNGAACHAPATQAGALGAARRIAVDTQHGRDVVPPFGGRRPRTDDHHAAVPHVLVLGAALQNGGVPRAGLRGAHPRAASLPADWY